MDVRHVIDRLQSVGVLAVRAQEALGNGDSSSALDYLDDIQADLDKARKELES